MPHNNVDRLRLLAIEAFAVAGKMTDPTCKRSMLALAAIYDALVERIEARHPPKPPADKKE